MLVALKKMRRGDKFIYNGLLCTFLGFVKEKHWYEYRTPTGFCYHIDVRTSDLDNDTYTVEEFVELTKNAYGGETIEKLK